MLGQIRHYNRKKTKYFEVIIVNLNEIVLQYQRKQKQNSSYIICLYFSPPNHFFSPFLELKLNISPLKLAEIRSRRLIGVLKFSTSILKANKTDLMHISK
jgi:hypothetical protein